MTRESLQGLTATEKSVALVESMHGPMQKPCPVCRGGWWYEGDVAIVGVHANGCPYLDSEPPPPAPTHNTRKGGTVTLDPRDYDYARLRRDVYDHGDCPNGVVGASGGASSEATE